MGRIWRPGDRFSKALHIPIIVFYSLTTCWMAVGRGPIRGHGGRFNINTPSHQYRKIHCGDNTILWPSYLPNGISYTNKMTSLYWIRALNSKLASILMRTWNRSFERNALIWLTCVKCKQRWKLMDRCIFRDRKLDPPIPASWAVHVRLGFRHLSDNWCDKLPKLVGNPEKTLHVTFLHSDKPGSAIPIVTSAGSACSPP